MTDALVEAVARAVYSDMENHAAFDDEDSKALLLTYRSTATAALQAIEAAGYRVVPVEATREMRVAGEQEMMARHTNLDCFRDPYVDSTYAAMLSAAPRVGEGS